jgi:signal peptidase II
MRSIQRSIIRLLSRRSGRCSNRARTRNDRRARGGALKVRICFVTILLLSTVGCDQLTKRVAKAELASSESISLIKNVIRLEYAENPGAFLSVGEDMPRSIILLLSSLLIGVLLLLLTALIMQDRGVKTAVLTGFCLIAGGSIGNLIDRLMNGGAVIDFVSVGIGPVRSGIFNLADTAILAGAIILLLLMRKGPGETEENHE